MIIANLSPLMSHDFDDFAYSICDKSSTTNNTINYLLNNCVSEWLLIINQIYEHM